TPGGEWLDVVGARFDPTRPYLVRLASGTAFPVFFYDGPIARAVAFGEALGSGDDLLRRLEAGFSEGRKHDEVLTVAVDGETFGHHRKGGDEVVAAAIRKLSQRRDVQLVNLAQARARRMHRGGAGPGAPQLLRVRGAPCVARARRQ